MDRAELERLDDDGIAAWDKHDPDAFAEMFADSFTLEDWALPEPIRNDKDAVRRYVIPGHPEQSRLLMHPLAEKAGGDFFHNGGKHFDSQDNPEWQTLKAWVLGQTMSSSK